MPLVAPLADFANAADGNNATPPNDKTPDARQAAPTNVLLLKVPPLIERRFRKAPATFAAITIARAAEPVPVRCRQDAYPVFWDGRETVVPESERDGVVGLAELGGSLGGMTARDDPP